MYEGEMMQGFGFGYGWGGWLFGPLMMFGVLALLVIGIVALVRWSGGAGNGTGSKDNAQKILRERFAAGEIDEEEFQRRRQALD